MKIRKRNGRDVNFDRQKIVDAVSKANESVAKTDRITDEQIKQISVDVEKECLAENRLVTVAEVQDKISLAIMKMGGYKLALAYTGYRHNRDLRSKANTIDNRIFAIVDGESDEAKGENSNKNPTILPTQRDYIAGEVSRDMTRRYLLPPDIMAAHDEGRIHFHDADYFIGRAHNCFSGGQKFLTEKGLRRFRDCKDGEQVVVKDKDGVFRRATVRMYGEQKMQQVTFCTPRTTCTVVCTPNHRWVLVDGTITTNLSVGDCLWLTQDARQYEIKTKEDAEAFITGFVVGDGCDHQPKKGYTNGAVTVRLCGEKIKHADVFRMAGFSVSAIKNSSDLSAYRAGAFKQDFLNSHGWRFMSLRAKQLAFHGYYAADGSKNANYITTADERVKAFIEETSALAGYYITSMTDVIHDTPYKKDARLISYCFVIRQPRNFAWKVKSIKPWGVGKAWCVEEPVTHTFTLEKGMVTGNCELVNLDDMLQNGTVITDTLIEKPHRFATACNIATQVIAQVASSTYGFSD